MASSFVGGIGRDRIREYFTNNPEPPTKKTKRVDAEEDVRRHRSTSPSRHRHHHHHHHHPSHPKKEKTPSPSSSYLIERELYALDVGRMTDWLMLLGKKVEAVNGKLTEQERMLAEGGPGVTVAVQDEEGRRYCPLWRRRRGSNSYMFCGRGWTNLAEDHGLRVGDVLRFLTCPGKDREGTGKLYLGIQVVRVDDKVPGGRGGGHHTTSQYADGAVQKRKSNTSTASDDVGRATMDDPAVEKKKEKQQQQQQQHVGRKRTLARRAGPGTPDRRCSPQLPRRKTPSRRVRVHAQGSSPIPSPSGTDCSSITRWPLFWESIPLSEYRIPGDIVDFAEEEVFSVGDLVEFLALDGLDGEEPHGDDESEGTSSTRHHHNRCKFLESLGYSWRRHGPRTSRTRSCNTWLVPPLLPSPLQTANSGSHTNRNAWCGSLLPCP